MYCICITSNASDAISLLTPPVTPSDVKPDVAHQPFLLVFLEASEYAVGFFDALHGLVGDPLSVILQQIDMVSLKPLEAFVHARTDTVGV